uniref:Uncharacterized protein n=1 Tax=Ditylenchus dipsaci TaxID=166011 RepID=A0A915E8M5_9BILA
MASCLKRLAGAIENHNESKKQKVCGVAQFIHLISLRTLYTAVRAVLEFLEVSVCRIKDTIVLTCSNPRIPGLRLFNKLLTISWLTNVIDEIIADRRATLNAIQSRLSSGLPGDDARPEVAYETIDNFESPLNSFEKDFSCYWLKLPAESAYEGGVQGFDYAPFLKAAESRNQRRARVDVECNIRSMPYA